MSKFDKAYFDKVFASGVHRHDFAVTLADLLIAKYGKCKILDIGTGCGYLVKVLRDKGLDAWGLEVSEYAVANSCAPGYIRLGDVRDSPYAPGFDVVFSQGLWCHIPEGDIDKAWSECKRIGKHQEHNIDYEEAPYDIPYFVTRKSEQWWKDRLYPKVLVACPNHELKEYSFQAWIDCVNALDYPNYDVLVVDNSPSPDFYERWKDKVNMIHLPDTDQSANASARINASMQVIQQTFLAGDYKWWFNLESDVIVPSGMLNLLLSYPSDWTLHDYEVRGGGGRMTGIGCSLLSRNIVEVAEFTSNAHGPDDALWAKTQSTHRTLTLTNWVDVKHLGGVNGHGGEDAHI
jgi:hypothetical protein